jgi:hypothetical protein
VKSNKQDEEEKEKNRESKVKELRWPMGRQAKVDGDFNPPKGGGITRSRLTYPCVNKI